MEVSEKVKKGGREGGGEEEEEEEKMEGACANPTVEEEYDMSHYSSSESEEEGKGKKELVLENFVEGYNVCTYVHVSSTWQYALLCDMLYLYRGEDVWCRYGQQSGRSGLLRVQ